MDRATVVSVVVPAYNEEKRLPASLGRIRAAFDAADVPYEIIVCDNNSTDSTAALATRAGCAVVFEPINQISRARNRGAGIAAGDWLLFVDADSWPPPELVADLRPILAGDTYVGCGSTIRVIDGPTWFRWVWQSKNLSMRVFKWTPGAFLLCRRGAFRAIGGFSTQHYISEELDLVRRLKAFGASRKQRFTVLHRHPFCTSGRRGSSYGIGQWLWFAVRLLMGPKKAAADKQFAKKWYDGTR